ncbi:hypothetical protein ABT144_11360 [Streptomyces sp. NPDC002039]|uniref:hypothetical protein n=1 Tax=Streptomyces sp. NPDC002039 TaxID=3154660 RepID=UPI00332A781A
MPLSREHTLALPPIPSSECLAWNSADLVFKEFGISEGDPALVAARRIVSSLMLRASSRSTNPLDTVSITYSATAEHISVALTEKTPPSPASTCAIGRDRPRTAAHSMQELVAAAAEMSGTLTVFHPEEGLDTIIHVQLPLTRR